MKKIIYLLIIYLSLSKISFSSDFIYETNFYNVDINNELIDEAKVREINNIKRLSFESVLSKILTEDNLPSAHFEHNVAMIDGKPNLLSTFDYIYESLGIESNEEKKFK